MSLVLLLSAVASAGEPSLLPPPTLEPAPPARPRNLLIPLLEVPLFDLALSTGNRVVFGGEWTRVTFDTIWRNVRGGWSFDSDNFEINSIGHPYQGSITFLSARSAGVGFWGSMLAAFCGSLLWEIAGETQAPSINDQLATPFGGAFLGEALRHSALELLGATRYGPWWLRAVGAAILDPAGALNRWLFDNRYDSSRHDDGFPVLGRFSVGLNALGRVYSHRAVGERSNVFPDELHLAAHLRSGLPGQRGYPPAKPFDYFDLRAEVSVSRAPYALLFITGLLWGRDFQYGAGGTGVWGLFGNYDFADPALLRVSTVSAGPGLASALDLSDAVQLQGSAVLAAIGFGAAGTIEEPGAERTYRIGPGLQAVVELELVKRDAGALRAAVRQYVVSGAYGAPGLESMTYLIVGASVAMGRQWELAVDEVASFRAARAPGVPVERQGATQLRVSLVWLTDVGHGATPSR